MRRAACEALGYVDEAKGGARGRMTYPVNEKYLGKLQRAWAKFGIDAEPGDSTDDEDEREYVLTGTVEALKKFYRSAFGDDPGPGDITQESLGEGAFDRLAKKLDRKGVDDPKALAATIGRKKYGKEKFQKMAAAGRKAKAGGK